MICELCPRRCRAERGPEAGSGVCAAGTLPRVARAALHFWEEPCISGERGSGAVFFSGCNLRCVYCQNRPISAENFGKIITVARLREIYAELIALGAENINLVTPTHFEDAVLESLTPAPPVPVVWNCGGYENTEALRRLEGKVQIYLPDLKYSRGDAAARYSAAPDYPQRAQEAILEMFRQTGPFVLDGRGMMRRGVVIRHLVLPGNPDNTYGVIDWVAENFRPGDVMFSLMSQFTPAGDLSGFPELARRLTAEEYDGALRYLRRAGIGDGYVQELSSAREEYTPPFDLTGV